MHELYTDNDNLVRVRGLRDKRDDTYKNSATVNMTLKDEDGTAVTGVSWPVAFSYVAASNGNYNGVIPKEAAIQAREHYYIEITAVEAGTTAEWNVRVRARDRKNF